jgi:hypothetical protein
MSWARERTYLVDEEDCPKVIFAVCATIPAMICSAPSSSSEITLFRYSPNTFILEA